MRRAANTVLSLVLGATLLSGVAPPAAAHVGGEHFRVTARTMTERYDDVGRRGPSIGDSFVFTDKLFRRGERVGRDSVRCDLTRVTKRAFTQHCVGTLTFKGEGQLTVQGEITFRRGGRSDLNLAITGGTRSYIGASGVLEVIEMRGEPTRYRIHLTR